VVITSAAAMTSPQRGEVVVGLSGTFGPEPSEAFRWTAAEGMVGLGFLPGHNLSEALGVSTDGSVIVGYDAPSRDSPLAEAFIWDSVGRDAESLRRAGQPRERPDRLAVTPGNGYFGGRHDDRRLGHQPSGPNRGVVSKDRISSRALQPGSFWSL
jgi:hypothetical protein